MFPVYNPEADDDINACLVLNAYVPNCVLTTRVTPDMKSLPRPLAKPEVAFHCNSIVYTGHNFPHTSCIILAACTWLRVYNTELLLLSKIINCRHMCLVSLENFVDFGTEIFARIG
jgi:hypothetical protein